MQSQANGEQDTINRLNRELNDLKGKLAWWNATWIGPQILAKSAQIAQHGITLGGEQAALVTAMRTLDACRAAVTTIPVEADPRVSGLYAELGLATGGLLTAQGVLTQTWVAVGGMATAGDWIARNGADNLLDVTDGSFEGRLGAVSGGAVAMRVAYTLMGQPGEVDVAFDFHDLERGVNALIDALKQQIGATAPRG
jgi:hypothetical protein